MKLLSVLTLSIAALAFAAPADAPLVLNAIPTVSTLGLLLLTLLVSATGFATLRR